MSFIAFFLFLISYSIFKAVPSLSNEKFSFVVSSINIELTMEDLIRNKAIIKLLNEIRLKFLEKNQVSAQLITIKEINEIYGKEVLMEPFYLIKWNEVGSIRPIYENSNVQTYLS